MKLASVWYKNLGLSSVQAELQPILCSNTMATWATREQVLMTPLNWQTPKTGNPIIDTKTWELSSMEIKLQPIRRLGGHVVFNKSGSPLLSNQSINQFIRRQRTSYDRTTFLYHL